MCLALVGVSLICFLFITELKVAIGVICMMSLICLNLLGYDVHGDRCTEQWLTTYVCCVWCFGQQIAELHGCAPQHHFCGEYCRCYRVVPQDLCVSASFSCPLCSLQANLVLSLGLSVDYSAHLARHFAVACEKNKDVHAGVHLKDSVWRLGASVFHGGFSTFVAVLPLAAAVSTIFQMFFKMVAMTVCLCWDLAFLLVPSPSPHVDCAWSCVCGRACVIVTGVPWPGPRRCSPACRSWLGTELPRQEHVQNVQRFPGRTSAERWGSGHGEPARRAGEGEGEACFRTQVVVS